MTGPPGQVADRSGSRIATRIGFWTAALHLAGLWALAFVQPLFALLGDSAEFFVARGNTTWDILVFALGYGLVPPLVGALVVWAAGHVRAGLGRAIHLTLIALLIGALVLPPLGDLLSGSSASVAVALLVGSAAALLYLRTPIARSFLTLLSPALLVFLLLFLIFSPVAEVVWPAEASRSVVGPSRSSTPIVHVILDELPATTLQRPDGEFESALFPNLARLVRGATWYRNATTVADSTPDAIPVQLTGERPRPGALPTSRSHPRSLFTLFSRSHHMIVVEPVTDVCPRELCAETRPAAKTRLRALASDLRVVAQHLLLPGDLRRGLPPIDENWANFGREEAPLPGDAAPTRERRKLIKGVLARMRANDPRAGFAHVAAALGRAHHRPPLVFMHSTLPHAPWRYLPDGRVYRLRGWSYPRRAGPQWPIDQSFQRHVLQVQHVDRLLGGLLRRLRTSGLYDRAVIVVTADHGASFRAHQNRRRITAGNLPEIAPIPFIVKYPGQREGKVSDRAVRTVDVLPTIAKVAAASVPWKTDGIPADRRRTSPSSPVDVMHLGRRGQSQSLARVLAARRERDAYEARLLRHGVFAFGPRPDLAGRRVDGSPAATGASATIEGAREYRHVVAGAPVVPVLVAGAAHGLPAGTVVAVAVNGRIESTTKLLPRGRRFRYAALVRPSSLRPGSNRLTVLALRPDGLQVLTTVG